MLSTKASLNPRTDAVLEICHFSCAEGANRSGMARQIASAKETSDITQAERLRSQIPPFHYSSHLSITLAFPFRRAGIIFWPFT